MCRPFDLVADTGITLRFPLTRYRRVHYTAVARHVDLWDEGPHQLGAPEIRSVFTLDHAITTQFTTCTLKRVLFTDTSEEGSTIKRCMPLRFGTSLSLAGSRPMIGRLRG